MDFPETVSCRNLLRHQVCQTYHYIKEVFLFGTEAPDRELVTRRHNHLNCCTRVLFPKLHMHRTMPVTSGGVKLPNLLRCSVEISLCTARARALRCIVSARVAQLEAVCQAHTRLRTCCLKSEGPHLRKYWRPCARCLLQHRLATVDYKTRTESSPTYTATMIYSSMER